MATSDRQLEISFVELGDIVVVKLAGRVIRENQQLLLTELERRVRDDDTRFAISLADVDYMDSAGLGCCSLIHKMVAGQNSGAIAVFGASRQLEQTWRLIRLDLVIPLFANEAEAVEWLRQRG